MPAVIPVTPGEKLLVYVGSDASGATGGFNGGANGGAGKDGYDGAVGGFYSEGVPGGAGGPGAGRSGGISS